MQNFLVQQSLEASIEEKTLEADHNAFIANHDELTGLPNRRYITELLDDMLETAKDKNKVMALMFIDLNGFKQVNDIYGHAAGDEVLKIVARRLELATRKNDQVSRLGGDEFLIGLLMKKGTLTNLENMAQKFINLISQDMSINGKTIQIGASIGVSAYPLHVNTVESLIKIADHQMYKAKHGRKKSVIREYKPKSSVIVFPTVSR
jgi:diguanylate cyclase (GGDEF)-like protein